MKRAAAAAASPSTFNNTRVFSYQVACSTSILLDGGRECLDDVGLRNIVTLASTISGIHPVVVKGGMLKSISAKYDKNAASL